MNLNSEVNFAILAILDGWGVAPPSPGNAISLAKTPNFTKFFNSYPHTVLLASGEAVGLPRGEDGNTETGHLNLGAGRIVYQDLQRINMAIADGSFFENKILINAFLHAQKNNSKVHFMGLIGAGGVHSNNEHLFALIKLAQKLNFTNIFLHLFTDGRDSPPTSAKIYLKNVENFLQNVGFGKIATIMGRFWAMDRDQRWDRTAKAYFALTKGEGKVFKNTEEAINAYYSEGITDEFIPPTIISEDLTKKFLIEDNDAVIFFNFRIDRPRQLTKAFVYQDFSKAFVFFDEMKKRQTTRQPFDRGKPLKNLYFVTMTEYDKKISQEGALAAFPPEIIDNPISGVVSAYNFRQIKITESEKERFVTFYFNGLRETPYEFEERTIIPSDKVTTYDQKPEMKAFEITKEAIEKLSNADYKLVVLNYPNADMVGHTGNIGATVTGLEKVDECLGKLANFALAKQGALVITADHGNAEEMINLQTGEIDTEHSTNPVPFILITHLFTGRGVTLKTGILADVAPTILTLLKIPVPTSMTGRNLLLGLE